MPYMPPVYRLSARQFEQPFGICEFDDVAITVPLIHLDSKATLEGRAGDPYINPVLDSEVAQSQPPMSGPFSVSGNSGDGPGAFASRML